MNAALVGGKLGIPLPQALLAILELASALVLFTPLFVVGEVWYCEGCPIQKDEICSCDASLSPELQSMSIVTEWNLVCGAAWFQNFVMYAQMVGLLFGNLLVFKLSDWYGLGGRSMLWDASLITGAGQLLSAAATDPYSYSICRFIAGIGLAGLLGVPCGNYPEEFLIPKWRPLCGTCLTGGFTTLSLMSTYISNWRLLTFVTCLLFLHIAVMLPQLPKSSSWYLVRCPKNMRTKAAQSQDFSPFVKLLSKSRKLPKFLYTETSKRQDTDSGNWSSEEEKGSGPEPGPKGSSCLAFFTNPELRLPTIYQMTIMCSVEVAFYGLCFSLKSLEDTNLYPTLVLLAVAVVDLVGFSSALSYYYRVGSRKATSVSSVTGGLLFGVLAVLEVIAAPVPISCVVGLLLMCRFCTSASQCCARIVLSELYPDGNVRMMGSQLNAIGANIGALLAVQLVSLRSYWPSIPYFAFAMVSLFGGLFSFLATKYAAIPYYQVTYADIDPTYLLPFY